MKKLLTILILCASTTIYAQQIEFKPVKKVQTEQTLVLNSTATTYKYKDLIVYKSKNDKYFVVKKSKNNIFYKEYLTLEKITN